MRNVAFKELCNTGGRKGGVYFRCYSQSHPGSRSFLNADSPILDLSRWCAVCGVGCRMWRSRPVHCNAETIL